MSFDRAPTILQVLPSLENGGVERGTVDMVQAIVAAGGRALVASAGGRMVTQVERMGGEHVTVKLLTKDPFNIWLNAGRLAQLIRREQVDLIHARSRGPAWSALLAARRTRIPFVTTWHGIYGEDLPGKRLYNSVMGRGERVIAASRTIADRVRATYHVDADKLRVIPRGVDTQVFDPNTIIGDRVHKLSQAWRIPADSRVLLLPARLTRWKGAEALIDAAALLGRSDVYLVLTGEDRRGGAYARALERRARRRKLQGRLRLAGHCADMPAAMMLADVVVSASLKPEPFGRTVIEAQALGRPVVAFDHGGAAETITNGETGFLVPPGDVATLASTLTRALDLTGDERDWLSYYARSAIEARFTVERMQDATLHVYEELLTPVRMAMHVEAASK